MSKAERNDLAKMEDVSALRQHMVMTQELFAARFGFSVATLRHWEVGDRTALALLNVIKSALEAVKAAMI